MTNTTNRQDRIRELVVQALARDEDELVSPRGIVEMLVAVYEDFADTTDAEIDAAAAEVTQRLGR